MAAVSKMKAAEPMHVAPNQESRNNASDHDFDDLLGPLCSMAMDFSHRCLSFSLFSFGVGLLGDSGFMNSLASARHTATSCAVTNSIYFLYEVLLANLRGTHDFVNAAVAGCCLGVVSTPPHLGPLIHHLGIPHLANCMVWGACGLLDYKLCPRLNYQQDEKISMSPTCASDVISNVNNNTCSLLCPKRPNSTLVSCGELFAKRLITTAAIGTIIGHGGEGLIASFQNADSLTKFSAIAGGILAYSILFLWELHGKDNVFKMGLYGATTFLFFPEAYGSPKFLLSRCLGAGALCASVSGLLTTQYVFPHLPPSNNKHLPPSNNKLSAGGVLAPFTLHLPDSIENGFSAFYGSLKKSHQQA